MTGYGLAKRIENAFEGNSFVSQLFLQNAKPFLKDKEKYSQHHNDYYSNNKDKIKLFEKNLNDTLVISLLIDKNGKISYNSSIINSDIKKYIPSIETILIKAIKNLPNILPATKTNIGVPVSSSFDLPLILKTK